MNMGEVVVVGLDFLDKGLLRGYYMQRQGCSWALPWGYQLRIIVPIVKRPKLKRKSGVQLDGSMVGASEVLNFKLMLYPVIQSPMSFH